MDVAEICGKVFNLKNCVIDYVRIYTIKKDKYLTFICPHCKLVIQILIKDLNCKIFRHGWYKKTLKQIDPHTPKKKCDKLLRKGLINGCGKPFKIIMKDNEIFNVKICDYI